MCVLVTKGLDTREDVGGAVDTLIAVPVSVVVVRTRGFRGVCMGFFTDEKIRQKTPFSGPNERMLWLLYRVSSCGWLLYGKGCVQDLTFQVVAGQLGVEKDCAGALEVGTGADKDLYERKIS